MAWCGVWVVGAGRMVVDDHVYAYIYVYVRFWVEVGGEGCGGGLTRLIARAYMFVE